MNILQPPAEYAQRLLDWFDGNIDKAADAVCSVAFQHPLLPQSYLLEIRRAIIASKDPTPKTL